MHFFKETLGRILRRIGAAGKPATPQADLAKRMGEARKNCGVGCYSQVTGYPDPSKKRLRRLLDDMDYLDFLIYEHSLHGDYAAVPGHDTEHAPYNPLEYVSVCRSLLAYRNLAYELPDTREYWERHFGDLTVNQLCDIVES